jgi:hypothetical protein
MSGLLVGALIIGAIAVVALPFIGLRRSVERRVFWCMVGAIGVAGALSTYPTWYHATAFALFPVAMLTVGAWAYTPYIKIGGTIYALNLKDRRPDPDDEHDHDASPSDPDSHPELGEYDHNTIDVDDDRPAGHPASHSDADVDSYSGMLTPTTMWWVMVGLSVIAGGNAYAYLFSDGKAPVAIAMATFVVLLALSTGYGDANWGYRIARGRYIPFVIAAVVTAGGFALVYLTAYYLARRWPLRRSRSMHYRAHPRHGKRDH